MFLPQQGSQAGEKPLKPNAISVPSKDKTEKIDTHLGANTIHYILATCVKGYGRTAQKTNQTDCEQSREIVKEREREQEHKVKQILPLPFNHYFPGYT